jgi:hypothetical protein
MEDGTASAVGGPGAGEGGHAADRDNMGSQQPQQEQQQRRKKRQLLEDDAGMKEEEDDEETKEQNKRHNYVGEKVAEEEEEEFRTIGQKHIQTTRSEALPACRPRSGPRKKITACTRCRDSKTRYEE